MSIDAPAPEAVPGVVIVHCGDLEGPRLERRLRETTTSVPPWVRVVATTLAKRKLSAATARRAEVVVIEDGGAALIERTVAGSADVVVLPFGVHVSGNWWIEVQRRMAALPGSVGVLMVDSAFLFAYPAAITSLDAPRTAMLPVPGISSRAALGGAERATVGAVLIVKDEERRLAKCLTALQDAVDEVVVYDTGSVDSTLAIAREFRVKVVEGYWDDDFSAARNRALAHATTEWVLSVDADEVIIADREELAMWLASVREDLCLVQLVSTTTEDGEDGIESRLARLFRREVTEWTSALHEQPVRKGGGSHLMSQALPPLRLIHSGYTIGHEKSAEKAERNFRISEAAYRSMADDHPNKVQATVDYARSLALVGRLSETLEVVRSLQDRDLDRALTVQLAGAVVPLLLTPEQVAEAELWTDRGEAAGDATGTTALRRAQIRGLRGDITGAIADMERLVSRSDEENGFDLWGKAFDRTMVVTALARAHAATGGLPRAVELLTGLVEEQPHRAPVDQVITTIDAAGASLVDFARSAPPAFTDRSLFEVPAAESAHLALTWYRALLLARPDDQRVLAVGSAAAARSSVDAALEWSVLAREAGRADVCSLRWLAEGDQAHPRSKTLAWALLVHGFGQAADAAHLEAAVDRLDAADAGDVLDALQRLLPEVTSLRPVPAAASSTA